MQNEFGKKLVVLDVIKESLKLYKDNFRLFIGVNAIWILISLFTQNFSKIDGEIKVVELRTTITIVGALISLMGIYFMLRINVALILVTKSCYNMKKIGIKESYIKAKEYTWGYIGTTFIIGLLVLIPGSFLVNLFKGTDSLLTLIISISLALILFGYVVVNYGFAPILRVIRPEESGYFNYSKRLAKGNYWKIFIVIFISFAIETPVFLFKALIRSFEFGISGVFIYTNGTLLYNLFSLPLVYILITVMCIMLDKKK